MAIQFKDFIPEIVSENFFNNEYATLEETVERVNEWVSQNKVRVISVETVVRPAMVDDDKGGGTKVKFSSEFVESYQFVRVWYITG